MDVAWVLANETRSLIAGEAVAPIVMTRLKEALAQVDCITDLEEVATLHLGPNADPGGPRPSFSARSDYRSVRENVIREITEALKKADGRFVYVYVRPSHSTR